MVYLAFMYCFLYFPVVIFDQKLKSYLKLPKTLLPKLM